MDIFIDIAFLVAGALLGVLFSVLLTRRLESSFEKLFKRKFDKKPTRNITGIWITQYQYPSVDNSGGVQIKTETQCVHFKQKGNKVIGETVDAIKHPEVFEGKLTKDRYFTGQYLNTANHNNYHGAFQFILSNSRGTMKGKWIGFDDSGTVINAGEWRWEQHTNSKKVDKELIQSARLKSDSINLFDDTYFRM
jgi:hypothetical protein